MYSLDKYYQVFKVENVKNIFSVLVQKISIYDIIWPFFFKGNSQNTNYFNKQ